MLPRLFPLLLLPRNGAPPYERPDLLARPLVASISARSSVGAANLTPRSNCDLWMY